MRKTPHTVHRWLAVRRWLALALLVICLPAAGCGLFTAAGKFLADEFYVLDAPPPDQPFKEGNPELRGVRPASIDHGPDAVARDLRR